MGEFLDRFKGRIKETFGAASGNRRLEGKGKIDTAKGHVKGAVNEVKRDIRAVDRETRRPPPESPPPPM